ncbi:MAG: response regulator [Chloroflexota bacterium]
MSTILIVEDNTDVAILYERIFPQHNCFIVDSVGSAIAYINETIPDLVILDFHLNESYGLDLLTYMRAQPHLINTPVLGISGDDFLEERANRKGLTAFLRKPLEMIQLIMVGRRLLQS